MKLFGRKKNQAPEQPRIARAGGTPVHRSDWRTYDDAAEVYARIVAPQFAPIAADLLSLAELPSTARILDVGTGSGNVLAAARGADVEAIGVDPSLGMLAEARRADPRFLIAAADTINFPFREAAFDAATASFVLPFFRKLDTALFEIRRVLKPGASFVLSTWENGEDELSKTWRLLVERAVGLELIRDALTDAEPWETVAGERARLEGLLRDAGFHPVRVERRKYTLRMSREDYVAMKQIGTMGRFVKGMLGNGWDRFVDEARAVYAQSVPEQIVDFRDVLMAVATKP